MWKQGQVDCSFQLLSLMWVSKCNPTGASFRFWPWSCDLHVLAMVLESRRIARLCHTGLYCFAHFLFALCVAAWSRNTKPPYQTPIRPNPQAAHSGFGSTLRDPFLRAGLHDVRQLHYPLQDPRSRLKLWSRKLRLTLSHSKSFSECSKVTLHGR